MPTEKRQRQREGREARREELVREQKRRQQRKRLLTWGPILVVLVAIILIATFAGGGSKKKTVSTTNTTAAPTTDTSAAAGALAPVPDGAKITGDTPCPKADGTSPRTTSFAKEPPICIDAAKKYTATVTTDVGTFTIDLDAKQAPKTVNNFVVLARYHFFDGISFHRVIPGFVDQGGDPTNSGSGGPGYQFQDELPKAGQYKLGSVAMANSGANTNGSQFFVIAGDQGVSLPPQYSLFGQVSNGMDVVKKINDDGSEAGAPKVVHKMTTVTIKES